MNTINKKIYSIFFATLFFVGGGVVSSHIKAQQISTLPQETVLWYFENYSFGDEPTDPQGALIRELLIDFINSHDDYSQYDPDELDGLYESNAGFREDFINEFSSYADEELTDPSFVPGLSQEDRIELDIKNTGDPVNENFQIVPPNCVDNPTFGKDAGGCGWRDIIILINRIIEFLVYIAASLSAIAFAYAGFLYMTAFGNGGKIEQAHGIFSKTFMGILFVLMGWLLVKTLLTVLGAKEGFSLLG